MGHCGSQDSAGRRDTPRPGPEKREPRNESRAENSIASVAFFLSAGRAPTLFSVFGGAFRLRPGFTRRPYYYGEVVCGCVGVSFLHLVGGRVTAVRSW